MIINLVKLSRLSSWDEELAGLFLLGAKYDTILGKDTNNGTILVDVLNSILNLEETTIRVKSCGSAIVFV